MGFLSRSASRWESADRQVAEPVGCNLASRRESPCDIKSGRVEITTHRPGITLILHLNDVPLDASAGMTAS